MDAAANTTSSTGSEVVTEVMAEALLELPQAVRQAVIIMMAESREMIFFIVLSPVQRFIFNRGFTRLNHTDCAGK